MRFKIRKFESKLKNIEIFESVKENKSVFLDSSKEDERLSKYSYIGINPIEKFECIKGNVYINGELKEEAKPFEELEKRIEKYKILYPSDSPLLAGYIGYISYDTGRILEKLPSTAIEDVQIPDMRFFLYENIIILDLINENKYITAIGEDDLDKSIDRVIEKIEKHEKKISDKIEETVEFKSNFSREEYILAVGKMKRYIEEGDIYIANMTQRYECTTKKDSFEIYKKLRKINKAPFSAYVDYEDFQIISSSPERFIKIQDRRVVTRPIKGTRPRGKNEDEDNFYREELKKSEKDKSELLMIVDLERNDLSKVCKKGSVNVTELFKIEEYETVFHLVSTVEGILKKDVSAIKCMKECFPGGSITGAPKIRAMEIIEELERKRRNIYTGAIGYFDLRGNSDFNIIIRTILKKGDKAYFGVGGGVTFESNEEDEYEETLQKAKALMEALK